MQHPLQWLSQRDRDLAALRRAGRAAIVMPAMFALGDKVIENPVIATFAAFGSFAMLLLGDFGGAPGEGAVPRVRPVGDAAARGLRRAAARAPAGTGDARLCRPRTRVSWHAR